MLYWLLSIFGEYWFHIGFRDATPMLENQMGKNMEHVLEAGTIQEFMGMRGPLKGVSKGYTGVLQGL